MGGGNQSVVYSTPIEGSKEEGFSHIYRNTKFMDKLYSTPESDIRSIRDVLVKSCLQRYKDRDFLGKIDVKVTQSQGEKKEERTLTKHKYSEVFHLGENVGTYLVRNKMDYKEKLKGMKFIGIFSKNRYEWMVADVACCLYGLTLVPLYDTLGVQNLSYCLNNSEMTTCFCTEGTVQTLIKLKDHGNLKNIISFDPLSKETEEKLKSLKFDIYYFDQVSKKPDQVEDYRKYPVDEETILTFSYTSGTTGPPKGAMLSHGNFLAFLAAFMNHDINGFKPDDIYLSFLPLPHVFERVMVATIYYCGSLVVFYSGDITKVKDDAAFTKPSIFVAVPRVFNRIMQAVQGKFNEATGIKKCLINDGVSSKLSSMHKDGSYESGFYDGVVFSKVREGFGGNIRLMITGSAPIKADTYQFMKVIMCCPFYEGYGQTQNTAAAFIQGTKDPVAGHVGAVASSLQFKLMDIPQMHYTSDDKEDGKPSPRGQVWLRGPSVFKGYYKNDQKTEEALSKDGWLRTGDVGKLLPDSNALKIIDRKKNIFKLQQGQYVASEKVEAIYSQCHLVGEVFLHGDSHQNFAVAIISPKKDALMELGEKHKIKESYEQLCRNKQIRTLFCKELDSVGKKQGLMSFEQAKNIYLEPKPFLEKDILTNTMKLQRFAAKKLYAQEIEEMYSEGQLSIK